MAGLHRPDGVFLSWTQEKLRWESRFMGRRRFIARDVCVGDAWVVYACTDFAIRTVYFCPSRWAKW